MNSYRQSLDRERQKQIAYALVLDLGYELESILGDANVDVFITPNTLYLHCDDEREAELVTRRLLGNGFSWVSQSSGADIYAHSERRVGVVNVSGRWDRSEDNEGVAAP